MPKKNVSIYMDDVTRERLEYLCRSDRRRKAEVVTFAIEAYYQDWLAREGKHDRIA